MKSEGTLLITGGTGFLGKAILRYLDACHKQCIGHPWKRVVVISRNRQAFFGKYEYFATLPWIELIEADILDFRSLPSHLRADYLIHAAADSTLGASLDPLFRFEQIVDGTRNVLEWARSVGIKRFLYLSSGAVYGVQPEHLSHISESYCGSPDTTDSSASYANAKRAAEALCCLYQNKYQFDLILARCFAFVGMDIPLDVHFAIGNFIRDAIHNTPIVIKGSGQAVRSYLDQTDAAHWLITLLLAGRNNQAYNVGSNESISIADLARQVKKLLNPKLEINILGDSSLDTARNIYVPNIQLCQTQLHLRVATPLPVAIHKAATGLISDISLLSPLQAQ